MIFLFFNWANRAKRCAVRNNTNLPSTLWPSAEVEPRSGLMTPSPAADGCRVYFGPLFIPSCSCRRSPGGCTAGEMDETFSCATRDLGSVQMPVHQLPLFVMLLETKVWFPKLMQPALEFSNSCGSRCAGGGVGPGKTEEQLGQAAGFFHDLSDKTQPSYFCCFAEQCFFFSADIPSLKLLRQTGRKETFFQCSSENRRATWSWICRIHQIRFRSTTCVVVFCFSLWTQAKASVCGAAALTHI